MGFLLVVLHRGNYDQQILDVGDAVHQIRRDTSQIFVGKLARRENVHHVRRLGASGRGYVHDAGRLLLLEVRDEASLKVILLLQDVHSVAATGQRKQHAVLLVHLHLSCHTVDLGRLEPHPLGNPQWRRRSVAVAW